MIYNINTIVDLKIESLKDLVKLKPLMENNNLKVNKAQIARNLGVDPRTVGKYLDGYQKPSNKPKKSQFDKCTEIISNLLKSETQVFYYRSVLFNYLKDNYDMKGNEAAFRYYLKRHPEFEDYFNQSRKSNANIPSIRFETGKGIQAQLDWKESITFKLKDSNEEIVINILVLILSYSRFRVYRLSLQKTHEVLFNYLTEAFEVFNGVPQEILTDNMKTVMDEARTEHYPGKVNEKFQAFADDFNFKVKPCVAQSPNTKAKVESPMRILDELRAYSGQLTYVELVNKLDEINNRENTRLHKSYGKIPLFEFEKEKGFLSPLPNEKIRNQYKIKTTTVKVNDYSLINYASNQYSVPPEYKGKEVQLQVYNSKIHIYFNTKLIAQHNILDKKINYDADHYKSILKLNFPYMNDDDVEKLAKKNLELIGEKYE